MNRSNSPAIAKAKAAIDDHVDWAKVHFSELQSVLAEISNQDFSDRCTDVFVELKQTLPYFSALFRLGKPIPRQRGTLEPLNFGQLLEGEFRDERISGWVSPRLGVSEELATATSQLVHERDGVVIDPTLRRYFPSTWLEAARIIDPTASETGQPVSCGLERSLFIARYD